MIYSAKQLDRMSQKNLKILKAIVTREMVSRIKKKLDRIAIDEIREKLFIAETL